MKRTAIVFIFLSALFAFSCNSNQKEIPETPNFLIFFVDDLRPELNCYGVEQIHSPNIDRIAAGGLQFNKAYCNVPVCGASRASLLTGIRPTPQRFVTYDTWTDEDLPGHISLPAYFRDNGYYTVSFGKVFHHLNDSKESWSEPAWMPQATFRGSWRDYILPETIEQIKTGEYSGPSIENPGNVPDSAYKDGKTANAAIRKLQQLAKKDQPFMFWVGFQKPHLPFNAPSKYWDLYERDEMNLADNTDKPLNAPDRAMHNFGELRGYDDIPPTGPVSDEKAAELIHGYYAATSYTDAMIGKVMDEIESLGLEENTIVAVFGDHGWNLGEHGLWCKHCNFNTSLQVPLIIKVPGMTDGETTEGITEFIDLFPTFTDLAGLPEPDWVHGKSLLPLLKDPGLDWNDPVYSRFILGNSVVTKNHIYTEFMMSRRDCTIVSNMLYDHRTDPDENVNVSEEDRYAPVVDSLSVLVKKVHFGK